MAIGALFLLSMVGLAVWVGSGPAITRFETLNDQYTRLGQDRLSISRDTLQLIRRNPLVEYLAAKYFLGARHLAQHLE